MKLFTRKQERRLRENGCKNAECVGNTIDFKPVVKLFCPMSAATWLLTEIDPENENIAFGLCNLGSGSPEIGRISLVEIKAVRGPEGLRIERDLHFRADKTLQAYADEARRLGRIRA